jgi:phosphotransacetylase
VQVIRDEGIASPILIGRSVEIKRRIESAGLRIREGEDFESFIPITARSSMSISKNSGRPITG